jgi:hypothetical protein
VIYGLGASRVVTLARVTLIALSGWRSCGLVITKFSGHAATLRSSPTVFADTPISRSTSTCVESGKPPSAIWSAAMFLGLYRIWASPFAFSPPNYITSPVISKSLFQRSAHDLARGRRKHEFAISVL